MKEKKMLFLAFALFLLFLSVWSPLVKANDLDSYVWVGAKAITVPLTPFGLRGETWVYDTSRVHSGFIAEYLAIRLYLVSQLYSTLYAFIAVGWTVEPDGVEFFYVDWGYASNGDYHFIRLWDAEMNKAHSLMLIYDRTRYNGVWGIDEWMAKVDDFEVHRFEIYFYWLTGSLYPEEHVVRGESSSLFNHMEGYFYNLQIYDLASNSWVNWGDMKLKESYAYRVWQVSENAVAWYGGADPDWGGGPGRWVKRI